MAIPDAIQTLSAAFSFGILLQAATGALLIYARGHGSNIFKDGRRLVLVLFLLFSVLWAQIGFLELLMPTTGAGVCQIGLIFTTGFDQLARVAIEQFLLWSIGHGTKITVIRAILQGLLAARLIVGGVLVGITRPQFSPTCVAETSIIPVAIVVLVMDLIIVGALLVQAGSLGMFGDRREDRKVQSRALLLVIAGFAVWTATSVPMILGIPSIILIVRTVVPANGLLVLVGIVTIFPVALLSPKQEDSVTAGAKSPFSTSPMASSRGIFQNGIGAEGSPIISRTGTKNQLFVVNPSSTPPQRDVRGFTKLADDGDSGATQVPGGVFPAIFAASSLASGQAASTSASAKRPKVSVRGLAISKPIVSDETDPDTPFAKIATIDLKTAVMNDRERREMASRKSPFNTPRAAPLRPRMSPEEMLNKANESARKGPPYQSKEWTADSGLSTSALLSPAQEVRRRSPRGINNLETLEEKQTYRPIVGLPSMPRAQNSMPPRQNAVPQPETVMLMNDIIYDNPTIVQSIISRTPGHSKQKSLQELSPLTPYTSTFRPRESVIDRARPIPRHKNTGMFGSEPLPGHRRTKSGSSIFSRKSFFTIPDDAPELPPLPPKPHPVYTAAELKKILPNDTKSMTLNEKIEFLFPAPPEVSLLNNRRSSVPDLPSMASQSAIEDEIDFQYNPISKRTTIIAAISPQVYPTQQDSTEANLNRETYRLNAVGSPSKTLVPSRIYSDASILKSNSETIPSSSHNENAQASTPLDEDYLSETSPSIASDTYRNSSYSAYSPLRSQRFTPDVERLEIMSEIAVEDDEDEGEVMVVMMDSAEHRRSMAESSTGDRESFIFDINGLPIEATHTLPTWHRRIGDELPAFSNRRSKHGSRKISPPTALQLEPPRGRASPILIRNAEASPLLDSPGKALQEIQDQLNRIEEPRRPSLGSILRRMPATEELEDLDYDEGMEKLRLLENLEREMGEQENDWQQMHQNFSPDSGSSIGSLATPEFQESPELRRSTMETADPKRLSLGLRRTSSRVIRQRMRENMAGSSAEDEIMSSQVQENPSLGDWQQRLANAQLSYMENAPTISHSRSSSINFLSVSKAPMGSPAPLETEPETESDSEYESGEEIMDDELQVTSPYDPNLLWQPVVHSPKLVTSSLWSSVHDKASLEPSQSPELPAKYLRPAQRRCDVEMVLSSSDLWSKSSLNMQPSSIVAQELWGSTSVQAVTVKARPVTQKPPRRSRRITLLADIVENPEPLPNKRDTLGIFQFPWGERSDTAIPQQTYNSSFQAGPPLNAMLDSRSHQLEADGLEYSSTSFFDYDEEEEFDSEMETESDDDFDETTLWEIASMLKTTDLPSKDSLLPPPKSPQNIIDDYDDYETSSETDFSSENEDYEEFNNEYYGDYNEARNSTIIFSQEDIMNSEDMIISNVASPLVVLNEQSSQELFEFSGDSSRSLVEESLLWDHTPSPSTKGFEYGLPQPTSDVWQSYIPSSQDTIRTKSQPSLSVPEISTHSLWSEEDSDVSEELESDMELCFEIQSPPTIFTSLMWTPSAISFEVPSYGLFSIESKRQDFRTTTQTPAAIDVKKIQRANSSVLSVLSSDKLWSNEECVPRTSENWMLTSTVKPASLTVAASRSLMWTPNPVVAGENIEGLFQPRSSRADYRTTELEPAALVLTSKVRSVPGTLSNLVSNKLWRQPCLLHLKRDHDWISESSIRPVSPSIASETSSGRSSPDISDASSIASTSTKASSLFSLASVSLASVSMRRTLSAKKKEEVIPPPPPPADPSKYQSKLPVRQVSLKPTPRSPPRASPSTPLRQSKVLSSRDIFEARIPPSSEKPQLPKFRRSVVPTKPVKPAHRAIRHQYRSTVAFRANWDDALNEAIIAGLPRSKTTSAEWDLSLNEPINLGTPPPTIEEPQISLDLLELDLTDSVAESTTGPTYSAIYNPAILHPVFFTETIVSDVDNIHPAAVGHTKLLCLTASVNDWDRALGKIVHTDTTRVQRPTVFAFMWKDALKEAIAAGIPKGLEMLDVRELQRDAVAMTESVPPSYDVSPPHPEPFTESIMSSASDIYPAASECVQDPRLDSAILHPVFFADILISTTMDIHPSCIGHCTITSSHPVSESSLWVPKSASMTSVVVSGLWTEPSNFVCDTQPRFEMLTLDHSRRIIAQKDLELPTLESYELWQPSSVSLISRSWLRTSSKPEATRNLLFQKPVVEVINQSDALMWELSTRVVKYIPDMFANLKHDHIQRPSSARSSLLPSLESTELYTVSEKSEPEIHWLRKSIASPVVAQKISTMWTANGLSTPDLFSSIVYEPTKRMSATHSSILPHLESSELFTPKDKSQPEIDWLRASSLEPMIEEFVAKAIVDDDTPLVREPTFEELMADVETLTEKEIAELLAADEFMTEEGLVDVSVADEPLIDAGSNLPELEIMDMLELESAPSEELLELDEPLSRAEQLWAASPQVAMEASTGTWKVTPVAAIARPDIFIKSNELYLQKSSTSFHAHMERLESSQLFTPSFVSKSEIDWLHTSCLSDTSSSNTGLTPSPTETSADLVPPPVLINAKTWMLRPSPVAQVSMGALWMPSITHNEIELPMFSKQYNPPLIRKSRQELERKIESTELWTDERSTPESPKHWLLG
ncbi:uncharacterized protein Bfra_000625 [Botrytis fragariae]|uniref:Uncharacterized protein n=1 Tax=Botrytis fragariae TaxID=1964551 RepID=A0A8H6ENB3_9HELO|nr:uncharacterized protein Bfra_000625 [Botrytis fragariae]KAF5878459.1 hypothetical protein Bfra_000625 [Botrytis fragariae]